MSEKSLAHPARLIPVFTDPAVGDGQHRAGLCLHKHALGLRRIAQHGQMQGIPRETGIRRLRRIVLDFLAVQPRLDMTAEKRTISRHNTMRPDSAPIQSDSIKEQVRKPAYTPQRRGKAINGKRLSGIALGKKTHRTVNRGDSTVILAARKQDIGIHELLPEDVLKIPLETTKPTKTDTDVAHLIIRERRLVEKHPRETGFHLISTQRGKLPPQTRTKAAKTAQSLVHGHDIALGGGQAESANLQKQSAVKVIPGRGEGADNSLPL